MALGGMSYSPDAGATDTQYWSVTHSLELQDISVELSSDDPVNVPEISMASTRARTIVMDQLHGRAANGEPALLRRTFVEVEDDLEGHLTIESDDYDEALDATFEGDLADRSVRFELVEEGGEWERTFVDEDGEETDGPKEALEYLAPDAHLAGLLKEMGEAKKGASWQADAAVLVAFVAPGGKLHLSVDAPSAADRGEQPVLAGLDPLLGMDLWELLAGDSDGELTGGIDCQLTSMEEDRAVIEIKVDVSASRDVSAKLEEWITGLETPFGIEVSSGTATLDATGEGEVTWNLKTGLPVAVELELELAYRLDRTADLEMPDGSEAVLTSAYDLAGSLEASMSAE